MTCRKGRGRGRRNTHGRGVIWEIRSSFHGWEALHVCWKGYVRVCWVRACVRAVGWMDTSDRGETQGDGM